MLVSVLVSPLSRTLTLIDLPILAYCFLACLWRSRHSRLEYNFVILQTQQIEPAVHSDFLNILRCPLDPKREATLQQDRDQLRCQRCQTCFPIKNGMPILLADEAELPSDCPGVHKLPCQVRSRRS